MLCLVCSGPARRRLCSRCGSALRPGTDRIVGSSLLVHVGLIHEGPARVLVRRLKYEGIRSAAGPLAEAMAERVPNPGAAVVPVPRVLARVWRYGIDPAKELAHAYAALVGVPVVHALTPALWSPRHAGRSRSRRASVRFRVGAVPPESAVVIDDVVTTGRTLLCAASAVSATGAITATGAGSMTV